MSNLKTIAKNKILVLGSTGKTGSRVLQRLTKLNWPVQSGSRKADPAFDWEDSTTWQQALQNIHSVYISFHPDLAVPGAVKAIKQLIETAVNSGVQKLVLLSVVGRSKPNIVRMQ